MTAVRTGALNALTASVRVIDLGIDARKPLPSKQIGEVSTTAVQPSAPRQTVQGRYRFHQDLTTFCRPGQLPTWPAPTGRTGQ